MLYYRIGSPHIYRILFLNKTILIFQRFRFKLLKLQNTKFFREILQYFYEMMNHDERFIEDMQSC